MHFGEPFGGIIPGARGAVLEVLLRTGSPLTGRQVHALIAGRHSLWGVQEALKDLAGLGLIRTETIGRAGVHHINEHHVAVQPLRALAEPIAALKTVIARNIDSDVSAVILFGSTARGDTAADSDVDLAVICKPEWDGAADLEDAIRSALGNNCDALTFTEAAFTNLAEHGEPVVTDIISDGVALFGRVPTAPLGLAS